METQQAGQTKSCPKCGELIQATAKRCKHCQADLRNWFARHKVLTGVGGLIVIIILLASIGSDKKDMKADTSEAQSKNEIQYIKKMLGEDFATKTMKIKINSSTEKATISNSVFGNPKTAVEGAKFVVVSMEVTNTTNEKLGFYPDGFIKLADDQGRKFETYDDTIGNIDDYLNVQELSPNIVKKGVLVYEVPQDANSYDMFIESEGTKEVYQIKLK
jgi:RNA polymerase subunit RPABC4/transcription elongation factor Spt4